MAMSMERLNQSSDKIMESRRTVLETEELGVSILEDLQQQRETLLHSHKKVCCFLDDLFLIVVHNGSNLIPPGFPVCQLDSISKSLLYTIHLFQRIKTRLYL
jgi:hypothetical protein